MSKFQPQTYSDEELRRVISNPGEDNYIDAKGPLSWDDGCEAARLAKDIAAFANSRDGGFIVIGKDEQRPGVFPITGLTDEQANSFETTRVANWINSRFSPPIRLVCYRVEHDGAEFIVLRVSEFSDIPVICTKRFDDPENPRKPLLEEGRIYVRTPNAASKPLQKESELRELIGIATKKQGDTLLQHFNAMLKGNALTAESVTDQERTEDELSGMQSDLRDRGTFDLDNGWTFFFHPSSYRKERWVDLRTLEGHIRTRAARLTDTFPASQTGTFRTEWGIANDRYGETWALARSGIFLYHTKFREDSEHELNTIRERVQHTARHLDEWRYRRFVEQLPEYRWIEFKWNMEIIIQSCAFMSRFVDLFGPGESISYRFHAAPLSNRHLMSFDNNLSFNPECRDPCGSPRFSYAKVQLLEELLADWRIECAKVLYRFFELFPDYNITFETLKKWVERYTGKDT
jgi:hypothetical protein